VYTQHLVCAAQLPGKAIRAVAEDVASATLAGINIQGWQRIVYAWRSRSRRG
jgi:hypothetical protein